MKDTTEARCVRLDGPEVEIDQNGIRFLEKSGQDPLRDSFRCGEYIVRISRGEIAKILDLDPRKFFLVSFGENEKVLDVVRRVYDPQKINGALLSFENSDVRIAAIDICGIISRSKRAKNSSLNKLRESVSKIVFHEARHAVQRVKNTRMDDPLIYRIIRRIGDWFLALSYPKQCLTISLACLSGLILLFTGAILEWRLLGIGILPPIFLLFVFVRSPEIDFFSKKERDARAFENKSLKNPELLSCVEVQKITPD